MLKNMAISILLLCLYANANAQQSNNWVYGWRAGIDFNQNPAKPFLSAIHDYKNDSGSCKYPQAISDCKGNLLYYIGGDSLVWNREHKLINTLGKMDVHYDNNFFIPAPDNDSQVYLFLTSSYAGFDYFLLNNNLDSGRGDFEKYKIHITDSTGVNAGFIKHSNDTDYWVLYKASAYTMHAYLLTKNGISIKPIISACYGGYNNNSGGANEPYLRCSNNGRMIITPQLQYPSLKNYRYFLYDFDKSTGKLSNGRGLIPKSEFPISFSFSPNDSIIYYTTYKTNGTVDSAFVYQMHTYNSNPFNSKTLAGFVKAKKNKIYGNYSSQLGADNRLYTNISSDSLFQTLSYIKYPDIWGNGCEFITNGFVMLQGSNNHSQNFPCHSFPIKRINPRFGVTGASGCGYDTTRFVADADTAFKSYHWYFGDGDSATGKTVVHQYKNARSYYVKLDCELGSCGYMQWVGDSVTIKFKPTIALNTNKTIYCGYQTIDAKVNYRYSDTVQVAWGDGKDTLLYVTDTNLVDSVQLQHIYNKTGNYALSCKAWNSNCYDSVANVYNIIIDTLPKANYTANYITSCGTKTIILSDTSKFDSVIINRTWHIYKANGLDTTIATGTINNLSFLFNDTGAYSVKLIIQSKQGCIDSLEKVNYIQINPFPVSKISGKTSWCGADSTTLTVSGGNIYKWSTGDTSASVFLKPIISNYYSVLVTNIYNCSVMDSVYISVGKIVTPFFTPNYTQSCGNSTITLTDSSGGMDSIIQQRKWTISYPNNIIKQYDTASTNKLKLIVQDTGYYNAKLIYITKQGCMDSLTKTNVFRILPQPVVYIDSPSHNPLCFGDSFLLTAKQKDINYPPLVKYKWNTGQVSTPSIKVDTANSYYVSATNAYGCGAQSNAVKISFLPQLFTNIKTAKDSLYTISTRPIVSYTWYKDTIFYSNTSSLYHPPSGRYYVHVVDANGCVANSGSLLHIGLNNIEQIDNFIHVYPNPVRDVLYIDYPPGMVGHGSTPLTTTNQVQIVMYDMLGKKVYNTYTNGEGLYSISIGHLAKGLYILCVGGEKIKLAVE